MKVLSLPVIIYFVMQQWFPTLRTVWKSNVLFPMITFPVLTTGEVKLVAMAPLTNLAVALRMDPGFGARLKSLVVMGGNMHGMFLVEACAFWEITKYRS